jgi:hypothetical protein
LEDHFHRPRQPVLHPRERGGGPEQDGHVIVVTARMHHAHVLAVPLRLRGGLERQVALLGDRERIHVGAQRDHRARQAAFEHADHARGGDAGGHGEAEFPQFVCNDPGGARLAVAELGVPVKVAPPRHHLRVQFGGEPLDIGRQRIGPRGGLRLHRNRDQQHRQQQKFLHGYGNSNGLAGARERSR